MLPPLITSAAPKPTDVGLMRRFPARPASVAKARKFATSSLDADDDLVSRVESLVSELATNVVRHARTPFLVEVRSDDRSVRVDVTDASSEPPSIRPIDPVDPTGRGLVVVESLADRWGYEAGTHGKTVWFEIDR
jgi:anti-sigma regulatory factor (Ser/Thr protein kinase)